MNPIKCYTHQFTWRILNLEWKVLRYACLNNHCTMLVTSETVRIGRPTLGCTSVVSLATTAATAMFANLLIN